jgi:hypothetical protein
MVGIAEEHPRQTRCDGLAQGGRVVWCHISVGDMPAKRYVDFYHEDRAAVMAPMTYEAIA